MQIWKFLSSVLTIWIISRKHPENWRYAKVDTEFLYAVFYI